MKPSTVGVLVVTCSMCLLGWYPLSAQPARWVWAQSAPPTPPAICMGVTSANATSRQLLFQRADQSLWLAPFPPAASPTLTQQCQWQLTEALTGINNIVTWSLSPDQQWLAYVQLKGWRTPDAEDRGVAYLLNVRSGATQRLFTALLPAADDWKTDNWDLDRSLFESKPLWSQDSQQLILVAAPTGQSTLYRYEIATAKLTSLAQSTQNIAWPQWSPDERYLLYNEIAGFGVGAGPTGGALWVVAADGVTPARRLSQTDEYEEVRSVWLDDTHIRTYKRSFARGNWDWSTVDVVSGKRQVSLLTEPALPPCWSYQAESNQLTVQLQPPPDPLLTCNTTWSPNGRFAAVVLDSNRNHSSQLLLLDLTNGSMAKLAKAAFPDLAAFDLAWSPSGDLLLWTAPTTASLAQRDEANLAYALWGVDVNQKQPFVITTPVDWPAQWEWLAALPQSE